MVKFKACYVCQQCGAISPKWQGQCPACKAWNSLTEETQTVGAKPERGLGYAGVAAEVTLLAQVEVKTETRISTGLAEFDRVLGGGLVSDSVVLLGGDPGIGKSTLLLQTVCLLAQHFPVLYVTGEESPQQVAMRAERLQLPREGVHLLAETNVERILAIAQQQQPRIMVVDSVQTIYTDLIPSAPGGVGQVRESCAQLVRFAKRAGIALFFVGHVTKEGQLAGPRVLEHMVDTVLYFEGQTDNRFRVVRAVKNRFGAVNELGVFAMTDTGLRQVSNPSAIFLSRDMQQVPGSIVMTTWEGSRPLLVEVQALVDETHLSNPRRVTVGLDHQRLAMLLAVLHRHTGTVTYNQDVFVNVVGGLRVSETASDLAVILAVLSSLRNRVLPHDLVVFGEIGLGGEIRPVPSGLERLNEAAKHGFKRAIIPKANIPKKSLDGMSVQGVASLAEVLQSV